MTQQQLGDHNVVATFPEPAKAREAMEALLDGDIAATKVSFVAKDADEDEMTRQERDAEEAAGRAETRREVTEHHSHVGRNVVTGGVVGGAAGGAAGFIAGAIAFGIPGIGPAVGAGIWAATAGGAVAGATAGGVMGGITRMWEERYQDAVREGNMVVGVHTDDEKESIFVEELFERYGADRIDRFDRDGRLIETSGD